MSKLNELAARLDAMLESAKGLQQQAIETEHEAAYKHWSSYIEALEDVMDLIAMVNE